MCGRSQACPIGNGAAVAPTTPDAVEPCAVIPYRKQGNRGRYGKGTLECAHRSHSRGGRGATTMSAVWSIGYPEISGSL